MGNSQSSEDYSSTRCSSREPGSRRRACHITGSRLSCSHQPTSSEKDDQLHLLLERLPIEGQDLETRLRRCLLNDLREGDEHCPRTLDVVLTTWLASLPSTRAALLSSSSTSTVRAGVFKSITARGRVFVSIPAPARARKSNLGRRSTSIFINCAVETRHSSRRAHHLPS